jgi:nicotinamidase-related amidase
MQTHLICQAVSSQLVVIDMQERLANAMPVEGMQNVMKNCAILLQAAALLEVPVIHTEQYPKGLGSTCAGLQALLTQSAVSKTAFSSCDEPTFQRKLVGDRPQVILTGMEAHICVLQTALALHAQGRQVFVVEDAVLSRNPSNKANALARVRQAGIIVSNTESVLFEWLGKAEGETFKTLSKLIR